MSLIIAACLTWLFILVIYLDSTKYLIPNWLVLLVAAMFPLAYYYKISAVYDDWLWSIIIAAAMFIGGFIIFALRWMGGGDVKLLAACGLWTGLEFTVEFLIITALLGGVLGFLILVFRPFAPYLFGRLGIYNLPRILEPKAPIPYGIAISAAMIYLIWFKDNGIILSIG